MSKILIAGDFCPRYRTAEEFDSGNWNSVLRQVIPVTKESDYSVVNFECAIVAGIRANPIDKCGPAISCTSKGIEAVKNAGFDCVTLANNHFGDFGADGVECTLKALDNINLDYFGGGRNLSEAQRIFYKQINGLKFAFINACEHEFTIAEKDKAGSAPLDIPTNVCQIIEAKRNADRVIVIVHGGNEFFQLPTPRMKRTYRCFVEVGADVVVNHHQHCFGGYEQYKNGLIFYGLGNFCFDSPVFKGLWNEGYMVRLSFDDSLSFEIIPYEQCKTDATIRIYDNEDRERIFKKIYELNEIIQDDDRLESEYEIFYPSCFPGMRMSITPYTWRIPYSLCLRHLIPSFITKERKRLIYAYVNCESHRDIFLNYLKQ